MNSHLNSYRHSTSSRIKMNLDLPKKTSNKTEADSE